MPAPKNHLKEALGRGERQIVCWVSMANAYAAEMIATAGFDGLVIDGEHAPNDIVTLRDQLQPIQLSGVSAIARVPVGEVWLIKQVLDAGAQTVLVPMVDTAEHAALMAAAMRYPPHGIRGVGGGGARATRFGSITDYIATANDEICLIVQAESALALQNLDDILAVDGVDSVFIGPADLSADMGHPGNAGHPDVQAAIEDAITRIAKAGKAPGILTKELADAKRYADLGATFLAVGIDVSLFVDAARGLARDAHALLK